MGLEKNSVPSYNEDIPIMQCNGHFRTPCPMGPMGKNNMVNGKLFHLAFFRHSGTTLLHGWEPVGFV